MMHQQGKDGYKPSHLGSLDMRTRIALVYTSWNKNYTGRLLEGAKAVCSEKGLPVDQVSEFECPGAFELPLTAAWCFSKGFDAVVCLGTIIRGDTPHFDYVSAAAADGILRAGLDAQKPCVFGVLTVNNADQAEERIGGIHGHKGREAAETALQMLVLQAEITGK
ncbi:MAG: hypothetical protein RLZZ370_685 [Bacteroidota bacterium]|jgi:6,7-dimethyl-8-ribityllumazine synthase